MKKNLKQTLAVGMVSMLSVALLAGCGNKNNENKKAVNSEKAAGVVLLSVNPEIEIEYDYDANVIEIEGMNEDGKSMLINYSDYKGKKCDEVVKELVDKIYEAGYFEKTVGGHEKNIVLKLEEGSEYPDESFLEDVAQGVRDTVEEHHLESKAMTVDQKDLGEKGYIGLEKAKELVLAQLGFDEATFTQKEYELDDGVYELEFTKDNVEYEYEVDAVTGKVLEADREHNDDWDDDDDRYDDHDDDHDDDRYDDHDDDHDDDDHAAKNTGNENYIGKEKAKAIVFEKLGVKESSVKHLRCELDDAAYEIEFVKDNMEYEYEVDAVSGKILRSDREHDNHNDHDDDRYDD